MRFLTKRFIGDYEPNTGSLYSRLVRLDGEQVAVHIQDTPGCLQVRAAPAQTREDRGAGGRKSLGGGHRGSQWSSSLAGMYDSEPLNCTGS